MNEQEREDFIKKIGISADDSDDSDVDDEEDDDPEHHKYNCKKCQVSFAMTGQLTRCNLKAARLAFSLTVHTQIPESSSCVSVSSCHSQRAEST